MKKVLFNGRVTNVDSTGCVPCGQKRSSKKSFQTTTSLILPSGDFKIFRIGEEEEVTEQDYEYLKQYGTVRVGNEDKPVFEVIE